MISEGGGRLNVFEMSCVASIHRGYVIYDLRVLDPVMCFL